LTPFGPRKRSQFRRHPPETRPPGRRVVSGLDAGSILPPLTMDEGAGRGGRDNAERFGKLRCVAIKRFEVEGSVLIADAQGGHTSFKIDSIRGISVEMLEERNVPLDNPAIKRPVSSSLGVGAQVENGRYSVLACLSPATFSQPVNVVGAHDDTERRIATVLRR
jgi:hypothetical protein